VAKVAWLDSAVDDLEAVFRYVSADNQQAAKHLIQQLLDVTEQLETFPMSGRQVPRSADTSLRQLSVQNYLIVYRVAGELVEVAMVYHGARRPPRRLDE